MTSSRWLGRVATVTMPGVVLTWLLACCVDADEPLDPIQRMTLPVIDLAGETDRQIVVDREPGQYLGHVSTVLLEDGRTILAVYPKGHGGGAIVMRRSNDGGLTWSPRLPTPDSWATSKEVPTIHRVVDAGGKKRLILWSGLFPARLAVSENDGENWSELVPVGDWGGIVVMGSVIELKNGPGRYMALFHDDGRFIGPVSQRAEPKTVTLYKTFSDDGGLTWSYPRVIHASKAIHLCEPGAIRSPDGRQIAVLLRENLRNKNSHVVFSSDEGRTWTPPRELPLALTGDRHTCRYAHDGRLVVTFRDRTLKTGQFSGPDYDKLGAGSPTEGDWVAWVGQYEDLVRGTEGEYRIRLMDNKKGWDTCYPGLELLPDGTFVATTYGHWDADAEPYIVSVRFTLAELDARQ